MKKVRQRWTLAFIGTLLFLLCCAVLWFSVPTSNVAYAASSRESESNNTPSGVEDPVLWVVDKASASINLKEKWGRKI